MQELVKTSLTNDECSDAIDIPNTSSDLNIHTDTDLFESQQPYTGQWSTPFIFVMS